MKKFLALIVFAGLSVVPLMSQDAPKVEVFGGYQYLYTGNSTLNGQSIPNSSQSFNGWDTPLLPTSISILDCRGILGALMQPSAGFLLTFTLTPVGR